MAYREGTIAVTNGSTTVTGTGTNFSAQDLGKPLSTDDWSQLGEIAAVVSTTEITLREVWGGPTGSGKNYQIGTSSFIYKPHNMLVSLLGWFTQVFDGITALATVMKIGRASTSDEAVIELQTNGAGRARLRLKSGSDDAAIEVSADGVTWYESITFDRSSGEVAFPSGGAGSGSVNTSGSPVAGNYARFSAAAVIEPRTVAEVLADIGAAAAAHGHVAADISDFDTQVRTSRLDQFAAPTAAVTMNSRNITTLAEPSADGDATTKRYVDNLIAGLARKHPCRAASAANITLSGEQTIDGVSVVTGDRVLLMGQTAGAENGIYVCSASAWTRATDFDADSEVVGGTTIPVSEGTVNGDTGWRVATDDPIIIGTTSLAFSPVATGSGGEINTGSNQGSPGVGPFDAKPGVDLQFRNIAPGSNKITVALNGKDIEIDLVPNYVATLAALKALAAGVHDVVTLQGRTAAGDGGEGTFDWIGSDLSAEVAADTESGVYAPPNSDPTGASGAWVRQAVAVIDIRCFGAAPAPADSTTACAAAHTFAEANGLAVFYPAGTWLHGQITIGTSGAKVVGAGKPITTHKLADATNTPIFYATGKNDLTFSGFTLDGNKANNATASQGIRIEGASDRVQIVDVDAENCRNSGVSLSGTGQNARIVRVRAATCVQPGISISGFTDGLLDQAETFDNDDAGIQLAGSSHKWRISNCASEGNGNVTAAAGILISGSDQVTVTNCQAKDNAASHGIQFNGCADAQAIGNVCTGNGLSGLDFYNSPGGASVGNYCYNNAVRGIEIDSGSSDHRSVADRCAGNSAARISVFRSGYVHLLEPYCLNNNQAGGDGGIRFWTDTGGGDTTDSDNGRVIGGRCTDSQGTKTQTYGIAIQTGTAGIALRDVDLEGNLTGAVSTPDGAVTFAEGCAGYQVDPTVLTLSASWVAYDANWNVPAYFKGSDNVVRVLGAMKSGTTTAGTVVATLPAGYRPAKVAGPFISFGLGVYVAFYVLPNGDIVAQTTLDASVTTIDFSFKAA